MKSRNIREKGIKRKRFEKKKIRENIFIFFFSNSKQNQFRIWQNNRDVKRKRKRQKEVIKWKSNKHSKTKERTNTSKKAFQKQNMILKRGKRRATKKTEM